MMSSLPLILTYSIMITRFEKEKEQSGKVKKREISVYSLVI